MNIIIALKLVDNDVVMMIWWYCCFGAFKDADDDDFDDNIAYDTSDTEFIIIVYIGK